MCGIAGIHRLTKGPVRRHARLASELLLAIESRGRDSTGFLTITDAGQVTIEKATCPATTFVKAHRVKGNPRTTLLHTRYATIGTVNRRNAHPVANGRMAAVHNGTIYNHGEQFAAIDRPRNAEVDSEIIPAVVDHFGWHQAAKALSRLEGGAATAIVDRKVPGEVLLARLRDYPLHVLVTPSLVVWASTRAAIEFAWRRTYGAAPVGEWIDVDEWTLLRVNGSITVERIPRPQPRHPVAMPRPRKAAKKKGGWQGTVYGGQKTLPAATNTAEEVLDDEVDAVMRWTGWSREEAMEVVYGVDPVEDEQDAEDWVVEAYLGRDLDSIR